MFSAVIGGLAGKSVGESIDPKREDAHWRETYTTRPYVQTGSSFDDYGPAYGYGVNSYGKYPGRSFDDIEPDLSRDWDASRGASNLSWAHAKSASRDAWNRVSGAAERAIPGDSDRDGR